MLEITSQKTVAKGKIKMRDTYENPLITRYASKPVSYTHLISFDEPLNVDWDGNELLLSDILGTDNDIVYKHIENDVERCMLLEAVQKLSKREKSIMVLRFGLGGREEKTQKQVADMLGISQSYISRLEKRIIKKLQKDISKMA